ncbi:MAG TPA: hypothetical protein VFN26_18200 [Candidatus Acidoferrum sp.]|nr:hypothetical protein [Candidatus Acidoferrum sp.]
MATVTCDVCGGIFNQSYLASHKRLAHGKNLPSATSQAGEEDAIQTIVSLYERLSAKGKTRVVRLLTGKGKKGKETPQM